MVENIAFEDPLLCGVAAAQISSSRPLFGIWFFPQLFTHFLGDLWKTVMTHACQQARKVVEVSWIPRNAIYYPAEPHIASYSELK